MTEFSSMRWSISGGPQFLVPHWPGIGTASTISGDGKVVFGIYYQRNSPADPTGNPLAGRWDNGILTPMAVLAGADYPYANFCSFDGSIIYANDYNAPGGDLTIRWTGGGSSVAALPRLGHAGSRVYDCTSDGSIVVGSLFDNYFSPTFLSAAIWTNGTPSLLANGGGVEAKGISADGSRILGTATYPYGMRTIVYWQNGVQRPLTPYTSTSDFHTPSSVQTTNRTVNVVFDVDTQGAYPAIYWDNLDTSKVEADSNTYWGVIHNLAVPPGFSAANVIDISDDGTVFAGYATQDSTQIVFPIKWTNNVPAILPTVPNNFPGVPPVPGGGQALACSADGSIVWGNIKYTTIQFQVAYWDASNTLHLVPFPEPVPSISPWMTLYWPYTTSISRDGSAIIANIQQESIRGWTVSSPTTSIDEGGVGDFWANNTYVDFSDSSVLAKFVNPDGSWLSLGQKGELPTGNSPVFWQTVLPGNAPDDFLIGHGASSNPWEIYLYGHNPVTGTSYPYELTFDDCAPPPKAPTQPVMMLL